MKTPFLLLGTALVFWGWNTGYLVTGIIAAIILEGSRLIPSRWTISSADFSRTLILCNILFAGTLVYFLSTGENYVSAVMSLFQWVPVSLLPVMIVHVYSTDEKVDLSNLTLFFKRKAKGKGLMSRRINLTYTYFATVLMSAGAVNATTLWFYTGFVILSAWALWQYRPKIFSRHLWLVLFAAAVGAGYAGHIGLHSLQSVVEDAFIGFYSKSSDGKREPTRSYTALGRIGEIKLSDSIVLRIAGKNIPVPFLLHEASYNTYIPFTWFAGGSVFSPVTPESDRKTWRLAPSNDGGKNITISTHLTGGKGALPLPYGASQIQGISQGELKKNTLGTVTADAVPGIIKYTVEFTPDAVIQSPPNELDLKVPQNLATLLTTIAADLGLKTKSPGEAIHTVTAYLQKNFTYSLTQKNKMINSDPVEDFLLHNRSGHCEYFATATVLLLRAAGIPARYETGYSMQEFSRLEKIYIVRARHAHAWAIAYGDGSWQVVDTTPAVWYEAEQQIGARLRVFRDIWSWGIYRYSTWWNRGKAGSLHYLPWLIAPVLIFLALRLYFKKMISPIKKKDSGNKVEIRITGGDSEYYELEQRLREIGIDRYPWESLFAWMERIKSIRADSLEPELLRKIISLHYRYRFDPNGINAQEREDLRVLVRSFVKVP